ncbi:hypothetical protein QUF72_23220 [Desulfobacterales bacterium HSG2]|nr:hypothetical protein [Desulfobacterales bacterium HSG2]
MHLSAALLTNVVLISDTGISEICQKRPAVHPSDRHMAFTGYRWLSAGYQDILIPFP